MKEINLSSFILEAFEDYPHRKPDALDLSFWAEQALLLEQEVQKNKKLRQYAEDFVKNNPIREFSVKHLAESVVSFIAQELKDILFE